MNSLHIQNLHVSVEGKEIVHGISLEVPTGKLCVLMGPNGSGKSSLVNAVAGHPRYAITEGRILLDEEDITALKPHEKARKGLFLSFQYPPEVSGVTIESFLRNAYNAVHNDKLSVLDFHAKLLEEMNKLHIEKSMAGRYVNEGFSGGEKKRAEMLQLAILRPQYALLDEPDSGLDVDALQIVAQGISRVKKDMGILLITHYSRILEYLQPDSVHIMQEGMIIKSGGRELVEEVERSGYNVSYES